MILLMLGASLAAPPVEAVVFIEQGVATCAGVFLDDVGHIATAYHCVAAGGPVSVETRDGKRATGHVRSVDPRTDLAIVEAAELSGMPWTPIREDDPVIGETVWVVGHPFGAKKPLGFLEGTLRWSVGSGALSAVGPHAIQFTAPVNPGNSGGPVVDEQGRLVGIVSRRIVGDGLGFAGRSNRLPDMLTNPERPGILGGTFAGSFAMSMWSGHYGTAVLGPRLELALRDHIVVDIGGFVPMQGRWDALQFGEIRWIGSEARVGLRQRVFSGKATMKIDAYGGAVTRNALEAATGVSVFATGEPGWIAGGALTFTGLGTGVDVGMVGLADESALRIAVSVTWPGTMWVF